MTDQIDEAQEALTNLTVSAWLRDGDSRIMEWKELVRQTLEQQRESVALLNAAKIGATWMRWWLDEDLCNCEGDHVQSAGPEQVSRAERVAIARLIAAAPELVEQLERSTEVLNEALNLIDRKHEGFVGDDGFNAVMDAQELLAKLYGDSQ